MPDDLKWARKHARRLPPEMVADLRAHRFVVLPCTDEPDSWEYLLCLGSPEFGGPTARGLAILAVLDEEMTT